MTYLVTGATGFLGNHVLASLLNQGESVRALVRNPQKSAGLSAGGADVRIGDVRDPAVLREVVRDVSVVFHCAAAGGTHPSTQDIRSTNLLGLQNLVEAMREAGHARLVFISGLSVLGMRNLMSATEDLPWRRSGDYEADMKIQAEQLLFDAHKKHDFDFVILRPGIVYGPGDENLSQVLRAVREGKFAYIGSRANVVPLIHVSDFVQVALLAARSTNSKGRTYHITDGTETTIGEIVDYLAESSGSAKPQLVLPYFIPYLGCMLFETLNRIRLYSGPGPIDRAALRFLGTSRTVSISRARDELDFSPRVLYREGIAPMLRQVERVS
jgi:nucleoside-diphosphate-sugar epimerase